LWLGAGFALAVSVGEFGATAFLARPQRPTMTTAIFDLLGRPGDVAYGQALALSVLLAAISVGAVTAGDLSQRAGRRRG
jgi:thiamine transport system permease protein